MSSVLSQWVDLERLGSIRDQFRSAASAGPRLFHTTRVPAAPQACPGPADEGWEVFLGGVRPFGAVTYERDPWGTRDSCYFGAGERLAEYTGLAAVACGILPVSLAMMIDHRGRPRVDRDIWTLALYRMASGALTELLVDLEGEGEYGRMEAEPWLLTVIRSSSGDAERELENLAGWRVRAAERLGREQRYVYGSLSLDVFRASEVALTHLLGNASQWYGPERRSVILPRLPIMNPKTDLQGGSEGEHDPAPTRSEASKSQPSPLTCQRSRHADRDKFIYDQACITPPITYKQICAAVNRRAKEEAWDRITSIQGIRDRAIRYATSNNLPLPPSRKNL